MSAYSRRILLVLSSHDALGDTGKGTGYYVPEAAHPWRVFRRAGHQVDFVSVRGGTPPATGYDPEDPVQREFLADPGVAAALRNTPRPGEVKAAEYAAVFYVGGHGTMWDFPDDADLAALGRDVYEAGGVVAAVCHGPAGLVNLTLSDGAYLVAGKEVAAFTDEEEAAVGLDGVVPFLLQTRLVERGAAHTASAEPFAPHVVVSERLVTGQNPASAAGVADAVVRLLAA
ncbi:type 1 glutamine amidotransferase domain-containing protein [Spongiactinospora sp. TRM90649]|uniref:type 1 glutamine amidotransferase domain-containing protein n=1 Tax=Spongiactinospora sp. TRM90649 TaxID=3031114 RepID=UPI0023F6E2FB|nr:type 1 glutamine amidotransferase domain-containing protein [Spongiactinospora sp. TRM90649]MDF5756959.1 type 1 glutamine amidotransferase domain-containing protein [Spongiactinospora sp. TRM90649]